SQKQHVGRWQTDEEGDGDAAESARTALTGALQCYRVRRGTDGKRAAQMLTFSGRANDVPSVYVSGASDWGTYQFPGAAEAMRSRACMRMLGFHLVEGAGHWVQEEQPAVVVDLLLAFMREQNRG